MEGFVVHKNTPKHLQTALNSLKTAISFLGDTAKKIFTFFFIFFLPEIFSPSLAMFLKCKLAGLLVESLTLPAENTTAENAAMLFCREAAALGGASRHKKASFGYFNLKTVSVTFR